MTPLLLRHTLTKRGTGPAGCYYAVLPAVLEPVPLFYSLAGCLDIPDERPLTAGTSSLDFPPGLGCHLFASDAQCIFTTHALRCIKAEISKIAQRWSTAFMQLSRCT